ncbi:MAG TPA: hypothetical protein DCZ95_09195 [Verrucomicrobia bacterium]|nr:hypothetical protein [Verrucomicrobiota bacterium]
MRKSLICVVSGLFLSGLSTLNLQAEPAQLTLSGRAGDAEAAAAGEVFIPLWLPEKGCLYAVPRLERSGEQETQGSLGVGYRHLLGKSLLLGGNLFYDSQWTKNNNRFDQVGGGVEALSRWVDIRANYYLPESGPKYVDSMSLSRQEVRGGVQSQSYAGETTEYSEPYAVGNEFRQDSFTIREQWQVTERWQRETTTTRFFDRYEEPMQGWDAELGVRLPLPEAWGQYRIFGGLYDFQGDGVESIRGVQGRFEARVLSALTLDAIVFEDDELYGTDWYAGFRVTVPLDFARLASGKNPFAGAFERRPDDLRSRLFDPVLRSRMVIQETDWIEDASKTVVEVKNTSDTDVQHAVTTNTVPHTIMSDVTFVDDEGSSNGVGTAEAPYETIQEGVDHAFGQGNVYVQSGSYDGDVVIRNSVSLYGRGSDVHALDGRRPAGARPQFSGSMYASNVMSIALQGIDFIGAESVATFLDVQTLELSDNRFSGQFGSTVLAVTFNSVSEAHLQVIGNRFENSGNIFITVDTPGQVNGVVSQNVFSNQVNSGAIRMDVVSGTSDFDISDNRMSGTLFSGLDIQTFNSAQLTVDIRNNTLQQTGQMGLPAIRMRAFDSSSLTFALRNNQIRQSGAEGISPYFFGSSQGVGLLESNVIEASNPGLRAVTFETSHLQLQLLNNVSQQGYVLTRQNLGSVFLVQGPLSSNQGTFQLNNVTILP